MKTCWTHGWWKEGKKGDGGWCASPFRPPVALAEVFSCRRVVTEATVYNKESRRAAHEKSVVSCRFADECWFDFVKHSDLCLVFLGSDHGRRGVASARAQCCRYDASESGREGRFLELSLTIETPLRYTPS